MTIAIILDVESTGLNLTNSDKIVEFAAVKINELGEILETTEFLVNPGMPIPAEASAVHHLVDNDVKDAIPYNEAMDRIKEWCSDAEYLVAHNAPFDRKFLPDMGIPWICTLKMARQFVSGTTSYSNQALRYKLDLKPELPPHLAPHRALYDSLVTTELFKHLMGLAGSMETLGDLSSKITILKTISFGKHSGQPFENLPLQYLTWLQTLTGKDDDFKATVQHWINKKSSR